MTERERWIVYPLLFLALGAALRDKLIDRTTSRSIVCQELTVVDDDAEGGGPMRVLAQIGGSEPTDGDRSRGRLIVNGDVVVVDDDDLSANPQPRALVRLGRIPEADGVPASGYLIVNGEANVGGPLNVGGPIVVQGLPLVPLILGGARQPVPQEPTPPNESSTRPDRDK
ncbi:MAG: hypothetical protein WD669_01025 [Pirellulales bacterium]